MHIVENFGHYVEKMSSIHPERARSLLKTGWKAQNLKFRFLPDRQLLPADRYLARLAMETVLKPLQEPEKSAIVSIFTPCEMLHEAGLYPYNVEGFSCYLSASRAERAFLQEAENEGISETLCSYHKTFIGAAEKGVLPKPKCIVYTNQVCDANMLTFRSLAELYQVPSFIIDVPLQQNEDNVRYVEGLRQQVAYHNNLAPKHFKDKLVLKILVIGGGSCQLVRRQVIQGFFSVTLPCVFVKDTVGLILQNPGTKTAELILNPLLIRVFHILTSLRIRKGGVLFSSLSQG